MILPQHHSDGVAEFRGHAVGASKVEETPVDLFEVLRKAEAGTKPAGGSPPELRDLVVSVTNLTRAI